MEHKNTSLSGRLHVMSITLPAKALYLRLLIFIQTKIFTDEKELYALSDFLAALRP